MRKRGHRAGLLLASFIGCGSAAGAGETIAYGYDSLGRLVRVDHSGSVNDGVRARYEYDKADNRTHVTVGGMPAVAGGSFEAPDVGSGFSYRPSGGGPAFVGNAGVTGNGSTWGFAAAPDGNQVAFIQSFGMASSVSLAVTGLLPGASYKVRFRIAARPGYGANPVTLSFGGVALGTFTPGSTAFTPVVSAAFMASGPSGILTFTGSGASADLGTGIDMVTLEAGPRVAGGGFEAPEMGSGFAYRPAGGAAIFAGNSGIAGNRSTWSFDAAPEGRQVAFLQGGPGPAVVSLEVAGLTPGAAYRIRYRISARPGYLGLPVSLSFDGVPIGTFDPPTASFVAAASAPFTASAKSGRLTFTGGAGTVDYSSGLDLVAVAAEGSN